MLVLSRRAGQTICFPTIDTKIEVLDVQGSVVRLGIDAPRALKILRGELALKETAPTSPDANDILQPAAARRMNAAAIGLQTLRRQRAAGQFDLAEATLESILANLADDDFAELAAHASEMVGADERPTPLHSPRALIVEDDANERNMLADFLRLSGYRVDVAGDGGEAMRYLSPSARPDIMLVDMLMPRVDGPTTVRAVRGNPALAGLKIFAVSGTCPAAVGLETGPAGIDRWFPKPLDPEALVSEMSHALAGR